ncbi:MAG: nucleotidyl transferase AbiEii/AbiGii toxin family protein, partial [Lachnospiraceae bacterium]|nr:nucleotidyl transferase AbiEii/AbiGii toxin family protein [Lachnospiraceae bacterium]
SDSLKTVRKSVLIYETIILQVDDGISFVFHTIEPIRDDDEYGGYRVSFSASFGKIHAPMSMDISTGDIITPDATIHVFADMLDKNMTFELWSYPIETVLAEKVETILSRGVDNTRTRDFYDIYMLMGYEYDRNEFLKAYKATAMHRDSFDKIKDFDGILDSIRASSEMNQRWLKYTRQMPYARGIDFSDVLEKVKNLLEE